MDNEKQMIEKITNNISKVVIGKEKEIKNILKGIMAGGHILIEDVPGVGKTTLVKCLAKSLSLNYNRIQFTPDLLPSDILGVSIYNQREMEFEFKAGPVFSNILLADEINRTSPKTQSALLEVMEEKQVSEGKNTYKLSEPFIVLATQNPIEHEGTFTLPEAQLDRFMIKVKIGYPTIENEAKILQIYRNSEPLEELISVATAEDIINIQNKVKEVYVSDAINDYIVRITDATRKNPYIILGASIRASLSLMKIAQVNALTEGRDYVIPEDVKNNAGMVLTHRIQLSPEARINNYKADFIIENIVRAVVPPEVK